MEILKSKMIGWANNFPSLDLQIQESGGNAVMTWAEMPPGTSYNGVYADNDRFENAATFNIGTSYSSPGAALGLTSGVTYFFKMTVTKDGYEEQVFTRSILIP